MADNPKMSNPLNSIKSADLILDNIGIRTVVSVEPGEKAFKDNSCIVPIREHAESLLEMGYVLVNYSLWTTKILNKKILEESFDGWQYGKNDNFDYDLTFIDSPKLIVLSSQISQFNTNDATTFTVSDKSEYIEGNLFILSLHSRINENPEYQLSDHQKNIVNRLRMTCGMGAAVQLKLETSFNLVLNQANYKYGGFSVFPEHTPGSFDGPSLIKNLKNSNLTINMNTECEALYQSAVSARSYADRFLFLWLAFESQTSSTGEIRIKYILNILDSHKINDEAYRLFKLRCTIAHGEKNTVSTFDLNSMSALLRLTCIDPSPELKKSVTAYEVWLESEKN